VLETFQETTVPLGITNSGERAWDPTRIHVSYHWLWLIPREIASRSRWNAPYHDGIRTDLAGRVSRGARTRVDGRLLAPEVPGLYWLQWDMVEEGATWFAQVSPRPPRQLVVVLPSRAGFFMPLPLVAAIGGVLAVGLVERRRARPALIAFVAVADVVWCAATLFSKQLVLVPEALLEPTAVAYWLTLVTAIMPALAVMLFVPLRARPWVLLVGGALGTLIILADVVYYRFFGDIVSTSALLAARQTGHVWGSIRSLLTPELAWLGIDLPFALWLMIRLRRIPPPKRSPRRAQWAGAAVVAIVLAAEGVALSVPRVLAASHLDQMFRDRAVVEQLGPFGYHAYDGWNYARARLWQQAPTAIEIDEVRSWFAGRAALRAGRGPTFGAARGKNLVVIQVESLQDFVVDYQIDDQEVMPHLRHWTDDSLRFTHVTDQTNEGRTSDAEFVALVSLLPLEHGAVAFRYPSNHYVGFPSLLAEHGYATLSAVPFEAGFWNRRVLHPSYGFDESLFEPDFTMTEQIGWGLNDRDFLQQMVPRLEKLPRPFCAWLITLSLHHPFDHFPDRHKELRLGALERTSFGNYLHTMHFFDQALEAFKSALARDHLLDDTMVVVFGDHDAGFPRDPAMAKLMGLPGRLGKGAAPSEHASADAAWSLSDRVPFFVRVPGLFEGYLDLPHVWRHAAGQSDFAPTLLALLGIDPAPLPYAGRNLLGQPDDPPVLRPYGDWLDRSHLFLSRRASDRASTCYAVSTGTFAPEEACRSAGDLAQRSRDVAHMVVTGDLQQRLRALLAEIIH
jgi:lipoteichoic acid synthase